MPHRSKELRKLQGHAPGERPGACSGLRSGAWPWKRNNGRLGAFSILATGGGLVLLPSLAANSTSSMEGETATPTKITPSLIGSNWPSLPIPDDVTEVSQDSPIQPAQQSPTAWKGQQRGPEEYEKDRVGRFAKYFKGNEILPIPEIAEKITPRVLSLVVSDLKTKS